MSQHFYWHFREDILHLEHYSWTIPGSTSVWTFSSTHAEIKRNKHKLNSKPIQSAPPIDEYTTGIQARPTLVLEDSPSLLTPKEVSKPTKHLRSPADNTPEGATPISQVTPLLGATPSKNNQIQHMNRPDDILDILGTRVYQGYVKTPLQTLDGIIVNNPNGSYH